MRKQIAAANWKMNLSFQQAEQLVNDLLATPHSLKEHQLAVFGVPFPYLTMVVQKLKGHVPALQHKTVLNIKQVLTQVKHQLKCLLLLV
jgi:triosephosphate isomerase